MTQTCTGSTDIVWTSFESLASFPGSRCKMPGGAWYFITWETSWLPYPSELVAHTKGYQKAARTNVTQPSTQVTVSFFVPFCTMSCLCIISPHFAAWNNTIKMEWLETFVTTSTLCVKDQLHHYNVPASWVWLVDWYCCCAWVLTFAPAVIHVARVGEEKRRGRENKHQCM